MKFERCLVRAFNAERMPVEFTGEYRDADFNLTDAEHGAPVVRTPEKMRWRDRIVSWPYEQDCKVCELSAGIQGAKAEHLGWFDISEEVYNKLSHKRYQ